MSMQGSTAKYIELSNRTYGLILDTFAAATRSRLDYWKSVWEIASRPYASRAVGAIVRENFDRASDFTNLTVSELHSRGKRTVDFSEKLLTQVEQLQDAALETYRDSLKSICSTVDQVKDAGTELLVDGVSTVDRSIDGVKYRRTPGDLVSVSN